MIMQLGIFFLNNVHGKILTKTILLTQLVAYFCLRMFTININKQNIADAIGCLYLIKNAYHKY